MRSDRRALAAATVVLGLVLASACRDAQTSTAEAVVPERFAGVRKQAASSATAQSAFCEKSYPSGGEGARRYAAPPQRPLPGGDDGGSPAGPSGTTWTWVNLWATWCVPCVEELQLLGRWRDGFSRDGAQVRFEFVSIDDAAAEKELGAWRSKGLPGPLRWLRSEPDLGPLLDSFGVARDAMIPIHALVDPSGWLRCVRVGAVHEQDYAAVKAFLAL